MSALFVQQHKAGWQTLCLDTIPTPTFNNPQNGWLGEENLHSNQNFVI
jgi:hypothetical protein